MFVVFAVGCLHDGGFVFGVEKVWDLRTSKSIKELMVATRFYMFYWLQTDWQAVKTNILTVSAAANLFFHSSASALLLAAEKSTTGVIQTVSIMDILKPLVASPFELLHFLDTSGYVSAVFFDTKA